MNLSRFELRKAQNRKAQGMCVRIFTEIVTYLSLQYQPTFFAKITTLKKRLTYFAHRCVNLTAAKILLLPWRPIQKLLYLLLLSAQKDAHKYIICMPVDPQVYKTIMQLKPRRNYSKSMKTRVVILATDKSTTWK